MISPFERWYRLVPRGGAGLVCDESGIALGSVDLAPAHRDASGAYRCSVRSEAEVGDVLGLAYGPQSDAIIARLHRGLRRAAGWIEAGDLCLASIETVLLTLPALSDEGMAKLAAVADLDKGGAWQDQPRVPGGNTDGGQWTADGAGAPAAEAVPADGVVQEGRSIALDDGVYRPGRDHPAIIPVAAEEEESRGSNGPPDEITSLKQVFPGFEQGATAAILAPLDGFFGFSGLADEANLEATMAVYRRLMAEIKTVDPRFVDEELLPEGGIAGLSWEGRNSIIDHLLMARASAYYRLRGDAGRLQVEVLRFLRGRVDQAYAAAVREADADRLEPIPTREVAIGNSVDRAVRQQLQNLFRNYKIDYGKGKDIIMDNRDYDTSNPPKKDYRLPDLRIGNIAYDLSLTEKRTSDPQIRGFFAADAKPVGVVILRPSELGGNSTYLLPRKEQSR